MTLPTTWQPLGASSATGIDWGSFPAHARIDAYLAWQDFSGQLGSATNAAQMPVIVELWAPPKQIAKMTTLKSAGLLVTPHYIDFAFPTGQLPRYLTARVKGFRSLANLVTAVAHGRHGTVERYEISGGFPNPDSNVFGLAAPLAVPAPDRPKKLTGNIVAFVDYGCAFLNRSLQDARGAGRVCRLWNQQEPGNNEPRPAAPKSRLKWKRNVLFSYGDEVDGDALVKFANQYRGPAGLDEQACYQDAEYEPIRRYSTHGTHIMDVATGYPNVTLHHPKQGERHNDAIVFVQLPRINAAGEQVSGLLRAQVLDAAHYIAAHLAANAQGVINLSYGANCGPHDGSSILERALDELIAGHEVNGSPHLNIVLPSGNALDRAVHAQLHLRTGQADKLCWQNLPDDPSDSFVELWVPDSAAIRVRVTPPSGECSPWVRPGAGARMERDSKTAALLIATSKPCQSESGTLLLMAVAPTSLRDGRNTAPYGVWTLEIENAGRGSVLVNAWCERDDPVFGNEAGPRQSQFVDHIEKTGTLNSIAHGRKTIVVGGYEVHDFATGAFPGPIAPMSGTGPGRDLAGRSRHPSEDGEEAERGPQVMTPCTLGLGEEGIGAAAVLSDDQAKLSGTSVSAAYYTRLLIENNFVRPVPSRHRRVPPTAMPGRDPHPDDDEDIARLP